MKLYTYISCWNEHGGAPGLGLHELNTQSGEIHFVRQLDNSLSLNATYLDRDRDILYIDNETAVLPGEFTGGGGRVMAYQIDRTDGSLTELGTAMTFCPNPAWPQVDGTGKFLLVANHSGFGTATKIVEREDHTYSYELVYDDAAIELFALEEDGKPGALLDVVKHEERVKGRALHSHPHCIVPAPGKNLYVVADKGECKIYCYAIDYERRRLLRKGTPYMLPEGSAPRYCVFHPTKPWFYVNQERNMDICCFSYEDNGTVRLLGTVSTLPADSVQPEGILYEQQGFLISSDGRYLYSVLNGPDQIAVFEIDEASGMARLIQNAPVEGKWPRGAAFSPDGHLLVVSCLVSGDVVTYFVGNDGRLAPTGHRSMQKGGSYVTILPE